MVYLLHLNPPLKNARHYLGATTDSATVAALVRGEVPVLPVPLLVYARAAGVRLSVERTWLGGEKTLARLREPKYAKTLCPTCTRLDPARRLA